jgi:subtilisin family serine protease
LNRHSSVILVSAVLFLMMALAPLATGQQAAGRGNRVLKSKQPPGDPVTKPKQFFRTFQKGPFAPGQVYVSFREGTTPEQMQACHGKAKMVRQEASYEGLLPGTFRVSVPPGKEREAIDAYLDDPNVVYAEPMYLPKPTETIPNDPDWPLWGIRRIDTEHAWDVSTGDPNFKIGIVDSGLNYTHPDVAANVWTNPGEIAGNGIDDDGNGKIDDVRGWNFYLNNNDISDRGIYHGTHVAGIIGAVGNNSTAVVGVNWNCKIVMAACGNPQGTLSDTIGAFGYILTNGVKVSNHSYGGYDYSQTAYNMFYRAQQLGHIAVCSAGNDDNDNDSNSHYPDGYALDNIISVGAHDDINLIASFSNYGASSVDLLAPGVDILSLGPGSGTHRLDGTSMAAPHVTGVIALIWSKFPSLTWQQMRARILTGVETYSQYSDWCATGGRVDATRSMAVFFQVGAGSGNGHQDDPYDDLGDALSDVPLWGQLYIKPGSSHVSTTRLDGNAKRIAPWGGVVRIAP